MTGGRTDRGEVVAKTGNGVSRKVRQARKGPENQSIDLFPWRALRALREISFPPVFDMRNGRRVLWLVCLRSLCLELAPAFELMGQLGFD